MKRVGMIVLMAVIFVVGCSPKVNEPKAAEKAVVADPPRFEFVREEDGMKIYVFRYGITRYVIVQYKDTVAIAK